MVKPIYLESDGFSLLQGIKDKLNGASKNKTFPEYVTFIEQTFGLVSEPVTADTKKHLGGFMEGEASLNVSAKKLKTAAFGLIVDPEFSITQSVKGIRHLHHALLTFRTGRISYKHGSRATMVFRIDNRQSLVQTVLPFYEQYVNPRTSIDKGERYENFKKLLSLLDDKSSTKNVDSLTNDILPIWDAMRMQKGQTNETFASLKEAQAYVRSFKKN